MGGLIKDKYRVSCLLALRDCFSSTSIVKDRVERRVNEGVKQSHILSNLKQLEKDGYIKRKAILGFGSGYYWEIARSGVEYLNKL